MSYKAVIFDFFGVFCPDISMRWLVASVPRHNELLPEFHAICGRSDLGKLTFAEFCQALSDLTGVPPQDVQHGITAQISMDESVIALARQLRHHYRLGLISNATSEMVVPLLAEHHLKGLFHAIVLRLKLGWSSPSQIFLLTRCRRWKCRRARRFLSMTARSMCRLPTNLELKALLLPTARACTSACKS